GSSGESSGAGGMNSELVWYFQTESEEEKKSWLKDIAEAQANLRLTGSPSPSLLRSSTSSIPLSSPNSPSTAEKGRPENAGAISERRRSSMSLSVSLDLGASSPRLQALSAIVTKEQ